MVDACTSEVASRLIKHVRDVSLWVMRHMSMDSRIAHFYFCNLASWTRHKWGHENKTLVACANDFRGAIQWLNNLIRYIGEIDQCYTDKNTVSFYRLAHHTQWSPTRGFFHQGRPNVSLFLYSFVTSSADTMFFLCQSNHNSACWQFRA